MGDNFDPCECINLLSHQSRMMRLLHQMQNQQSECTDSECFTEGSGLPTSATTGSNGDFSISALLFAWVIVAVVLFIIRSAKGTTKSSKGQGVNPGRPDEPEPIF